jgi:hypothetical protein
MRCGRKGGFLKPKEGIFETLERELRDPTRGILRPLEGNYDTLGGIVVSPCRE